MNIGVDIVIPGNITKEHIVSAIKEIEKNGYPVVREPTTYYIKYNEKRYPAKYVISLSNKFANAQELEHENFSGGAETNEFLKYRGFEIVTGNESDLNSINKKFDLQKLILQYDKNRKLFGKGKITEKEAMELRSQFVLDFPIDKILDIKIDNYVVGKRLDSGEPNRKTFCYRLEFELHGFGNIGGVNAIKFGIYYSPKDRKYIYIDNKFPSAEEAYKEVITQINMLFKSGKQFTGDNDWKKLSDAFERVDAIKSIVKSKILAVYFPDSIALINSDNGIKQILKLLFHIPDEEIKKEFMLKKQKLWELKENHPIMKNWSNFDYSDFVWYAWKNYFDTSSKLLSLEENSENVNQLKTGFWVVRAGSIGDEKEKEILENNVVTINRGAGDLSGFADRQSLKREFARPSPGSKNQFIATISSELWNFAKEIKKGDIAILPQLSKDSKHDVAIGQIAGVYDYRNDLPKDINNTRPVIWLHKNIPISEFTKDAKDSFGRPLTVFKITKPAALQSIADTMKKYNILPKELENLQFGITERRESQIKDSNYVNPSSYSNYLND